MGKLYQLSHQNTQLYDPFSQWGISGTEKKAVPEPVPPRVQSWIKNKAIIEVEESEEKQAKGINPVSGLNAQNAIERIAELSLEELKLVLELEERVTVQRAAASRVEEIEKAGGDNGQQSNTSGSDGTGIQSGNVPGSPGPEGSNPGAVPGMGSNQT